MWIQIEAIYLQFHQHTGQWMLSTNRLLSLAIMVVAHVSTCCFHSPPPKKKPHNPQLQYHRTNISISKTLIPLKPVSLHSLTEEQCYSRSENWLLQRNIPREGSQVSLHNSLLRRRLNKRDSIYSKPWRLGWLIMISDSNKLQTQLSAMNLLPSSHLRYYWLQDLLLILSVSFARWLEVWQAAPS